jgi:divalent metal cation (Fe/Co/Zn/Cd) transporter
MPFSLLSASSLVAASSRSTKARTAALVTGDGLWDGLGTIAIGVLLVAIAAVLGREIRSLLLGEAAGKRVLRRIEAALTAPDSIESIDRVRTMHLSPDQDRTSSRSTSSPGSGPGGRSAEPEALSPGP